MNNTNLKTTLLSRILQSLIDGALLGFVLIAIFTFLKFTNIYVDNYIPDKSLLVASLYAFFRFVQLQFFSKK